MNSTKLNLNRNKDFGGLFNVTIAFIKQNFKQYLKTMLLYVFPFMLLAGFAMSFIFQSLDIFDLENLLVSPDELPEINWLNFTTAYLSSMFFYGIAFILMCAIAFRYVQLYVERDSISQLTSKDIWNESKGSIGWLIGYLIILFLSFMFSYIGIVLLCVFIANIISGWLLVVIVPILIVLFFYTLITCMFIIPLKMEEPQLSFFEILRKCFQLIKGNWWKSFGFIFVFGFLLTLISYVFLLPAYIVMFSMSMLQNNTIAQLLAGLITGMSYGLAILVGSFVYIAIAILFYSLYDKFTGSSLKNQIDSIGSGLNYDTLEDI